MSASSAARARLAAMLNLSAADQDEFDRRLEDVIVAEVGHHIVSNQAAADRAQKAAARSREIIARLVQELADADARSPRARAHGTPEARP